MPTLEMAVDRLRQVVYFVGAGIKSGVEDEILKAIAAMLVKAQIADGRAAVERAFQTNCGPLFCRNLR